jgi:hypothetical protein
MWHQVWFIVYKKGSDATKGSYEGFFILYFEFES